MCDDGKVAGSVPSWQGAFMFCVLGEENSEQEDPLRWIAGVMKWLVGVMRILSRSPQPSEKFECMRTQFRHIQVSSRAG